MIKQLKNKDIINKHKGKKCLVVGHGISLNPYLDRLNEFKEDGYIIIGCNNWSEFYPSCVPHYWINANTVDNVVNQMDIINKYKPIWVFADSVDLNSKTWISENINVDYLPYDQRHFGGKECGVCDTFGCKKSIVPNRLTIQEELQKYTGHDNHYGTGDTVILHAISFSIIMGCSEIYLVGLDFDYRTGYAKNDTGRSTNDLGYFDNNRYGSCILNDMKIIRDSVDRIDTTIYNTNKETSWNIFNIKEL